MKRLLYLDKKSDEINDLLSGNKNIIIRAANIKKYPYKMIEKGYRVYFMNNNREGIILASALVEETLFVEESDNRVKNELLSRYDFRLNKKKMDYILQRKYISIFTLRDIKKEHATLDHSLYGVKEDWMLITNIE